MGTKIYSQKQGARSRQANPLEMLLVTLLFVVALLYGVTAFGSGNPLWFLPNKIDARPYAIEIYHEGKKHLLSPEDPGYDALTDELNEEMQHIRGYYQYGFHPRALKTARARATIVIMLYDKPLDFRTRWNLGTPNRLLIPVTGSGSGKNRVYTGTGELYGHGALILEDLSSFTEIVTEKLGYKK